MTVIIRVGAKETKLAPLNGTLVIDVDRLRNLNWGFSENSVRNLDSRSRERIFTEDTHKKAMMAIKRLCEELTLVSSNLELLS